VALSLGQRERFDAILGELIDQLPDHLHVLLEEVPLIVEDEPSDELLEDMGMDPYDSELCGLHWGTALTERSVEAPPSMPDRMMLFRGPIMRMAGALSRRGVRREAELTEQIRVTLLHEIGHHFGLDEDDLDALGYG